MRHPTTPRWLVAPVAALTVVALCAFGGDENRKLKDKDKQQADDGTVVLEEEFLDDRNGWGGESSPELEVVVDEQADTFNYVVHQDLNHYIEYFPDALLPQTQKLRDVQLEAEVSFTSPGAAGVECRVADPTGESGDFSSYVFAAFPDGHVSIMKTPADGGEPESLATTEGEPALFDDAGESFVAIGAECVGGKGGKPARLALSIDGEQVLTARDSDDPLATGGILLVGAKSSADIEAGGFQPYAVVWDRVTLTEL
jgi:hypothetical protein